MILLGLFLLLFIALFAIFFLNDLISHLLLNNYTGPFNC